MTAIWMGVAVGVGAIGAVAVILAKVLRPRGSTQELGSMSEQWVGEQRMNDRSFDR